jgi:hypothetical protein
MNENDYEAKGMADSSRPVSFVTLRSAGQRIGWIRLAGRLAPEDGVSSVVEVVKQVLDLWAGV